MASIRQGGVSLNFNIDLIELGEKIIDAFTGSSDDNREAFVINLRNTAYYEADEQYNVMVFNLAVSHSDQLEGVQVYGSANYGDLIYGIWVFESGTFVNEGDGGYINWAFIGQWDRDEGSVSFY